MSADVTIHNLDTIVQTCASDGARGHGRHLVAPVINTVAFGRRCIPPQAALGIVRVGSNTASMLPPPALRGGRLDDLGA